MLISAESYSKVPKGAYQLRCDAVKLSLDSL